MFNPQNNPMRHIWILLFSLLKGEDSWPQRAWVTHPKPCSLSRRAAFQCRQPGSSPCALKPCPTASVLSELLWHDSSRESGELAWLKKQIHKAVPELPHVTYPPRSSHSALWFSNHKLLRKFPFSCLSLKHLSLHTWLPGLRCDLWAPASPHFWWVTTTANYQLFLPRNEFAGREGPLKSKWFSIFIILL